MMIGVTDLQIIEKWIEDLLKIGYEYVPKESPNWRFFRKENGERALIIYMSIFIIVTNGKTIFISRLSNKA